MFQSQTGAIRRNKVRLYWDNKTMFQSQTGAIRRQRKHTPERQM